MESGTEPVVAAPVTPESFVGDEAARRARRRGRWWGGLTFGGAGLLFTSFFLPAVNACGSPVIPASIAFEAVHERGTQWGLYLCMAGPAYVFGLLVGLAALLRLFGVKRFQRGLAGATTVLLSAVPLMLFWYWGRTIQSFISEDRLSDVWPADRSQWEGYLVFVMLPLLSLLLVYRTRYKSSAWLARSFFGAVWCVLWFGMYLVETPRVDVHYGLWCSFVASLAVMVGLAGEGAALTGVSWFRSAGRLLRGRVGRFLEDVGRCPQCQYALIGQTTPRCPECGRPFEWGEVGLAGPVGLQGTPARIRSSPAGLAVRGSSA